MFLKRQKKLKLIKKMKEIEWEDEGWSRGNIGEEREEEIGDKEKFRGGQRRGKIREER